MTSGVYVQYGAALDCPEGWLNFNSSPTLRAQKIPILGKMIVRKTRQFPDGLLFGDILSGLPVEKASAAGVYASHVLEHLSLSDFRSALRNTLNLLRPGGTFRLIVPDLAERARRYLASAEAGDCEASSAFMRSTHLGRETRARGLIGSIRAGLGASAHLWMWDEASIKHEVESAGFVSVRRCSFGDASDPMFALVERKDRFIDSDFTPEIHEIAMEALRPPVSAKSGNAP